MVELYVRLVLFSISLIPVFVVTAQNPGEKQRKLSLFDLISGQEHLKVELNTQVDSLVIMKQRPFESRGTVVFRGESLSLELPVKVNVRGKFRRRTCDFPPLLLDFPKDDLEDNNLKKSDEYKLVTHCLDIKEAEEYLYREYLVYQMYGILEPSGFRAVVFPIKYNDTDKQSSIRSHAMLLESNDELKDRLGGKWCDCMGMAPDSINDYYRELVIFFQYMIGNKDMNLHIEHNVRFLEGKHIDKKIPIPYDFDFSAFVRAPYAFEDQTVTYDRSPLPVGKNPVEFQKVLKLFKERKEDLFRVINDFKLLSKKHRKRCNKFMEDFYRHIERPGFASRYLRRGN